MLRNTLEEAGPRGYGTELDVAGLRIHFAQTAVELTGIAIADPFDAKRNLVEMGSVVVELEPSPLLEKKFVVKRLTIGDVPAPVLCAPRRPVPLSGGGFAPSALREMQRWAKQFDVPLLSLTPIDTIKSIILDPAQLASVKAAIAVRATDGLDAADPGAWLHVTADSANARLIARAADATAGHERPHPRHQWRARGGE